MLCFLAVLAGYTEALGVIWGDCSLFEHYAANDCGRFRQALVLFRVILAKLLVFRVLLTSFRNA